jgi:isopenicillin-N epimerase
MRAMVPDGWNEIMRRNHALALQGRDIVCQALGIEPPAPNDMLGSIVSMRLPSHDAERHARVMARPTLYHDALQDRLLNHHKFQVPVWSVPGSTTRICRISAQLYNEPREYEQLATALREELAHERTL